MPTKIDGAPARPAGEERQKLLERIGSMSLGELTVAEFHLLLELFGVRYNMPPLFQCDMAASTLAQSLRKRGKLPS